MILVRIRIFLPAGQLENNDQIPESLQNIIIFMKLNKWNDKYCIRDLLSLELFRKNFQKKEQKKKDF